MAKVVTAQDEAFLEAETILQAEKPVGPPTIRVKVVYRGNNVCKTVYMPGSVGRQEEGGPGFASDHGHTQYDFASVDNRMVRLSEEHFYEGQRYSWVEHAGHVLRLLQMKDEDGAAQFRVVGSRADIDKIKLYAEAVRQQKLMRARNPYDPGYVLREMGLQATEVA